MRNRLYDFRTEMPVQDLGMCATDQPRIAKALNTAQRRLLLAAEAGDEGWMGSWAEMAFTVSQTNPYITLPRDVARIQKMAVCQRPVNIQNQFYEYLNFGAGPQPSQCTTGCYGSKWDVVAYSRNNAVTFVEMTNAPQFIRIYSADTTGADAVKRILVQGIDANNNTLYSLDTGAQVSGIFSTLELPFVDVMQGGVQVAFNRITGIQKDVTRAPVQIFQVDPTTGAEILIHIMEPTETVASYRRYYLGPLPLTCCNPQDTTVAVTGICKLELVPVVADTDYLLIQNLEALMEECQANRYDAMDNDSAKAMADKHHKAAIRLLQGELVHYLGKEKPAISFHPFGSTHLSAKGVGMI